MAEITYRDAVIRGIAQEMSRDPDVVFLGEDVAKAGGVFKATVGLYEQFGPLRVRDTPISEQAILGAAMGAAMTGLKPIAEIMFSDFFAVCFDYIANEFPKSRYMSERADQMPAGGAHRQRRRLALRRATLTERRELVHDDSGPQGRGAVDAARRHRPAGGCGARSRSGDFPRAQVALRRPKARFPTARSSIRLGTAKIVRPGKDATIVALALMVPRALAAAETLKAEHGIDCEVIDVRSLVPLDTQTILGSVAKTHRLFTVEENPRLCGWGAEIVSIAADEGFYDLTARQYGSPRRIFRCRPPISWKISCCRPRTGSQIP